MIALVLAMDLNGAIGKNGAMPWPVIPYDLKYFKELTLCHYIIMGRKTYDSIGGPLIDRLNIVVSKSGNVEMHRRVGKKLKDIGPITMVVDSLDKAIAMCSPRSTSFIIGGKTLYDEYWTKADQIFLTRVKETYEDCDTFMPDVDEALYRVKSIKTMYRRPWKFEYPDIDIIIYDRIPEVDKRPYVYPEHFIYLNGRVQPRTFQCPPR